MYIVKVQLPSRGKYGDSFTMLKRPKIGDLRDYLAFSGNSVVAKNQLIKNLSSIDLSKYPVGDREFVFVNIRNMVSAPVIADYFTCKKCGETVNYRFDTRESKVYELPSNFVKDYELKFPFSGELKIINILTVEKEELLEEYIEYYESSDRSDLKHIDLGEDLYTFAKRACMLSDTVDIESLEDNIDFLLDLDVADFEILETYDLMFPCGPELIVSTQCENKDCKQTYALTLKTDSTFFGLSWSTLLRKHRFLARHSSNSFDDFLKYTIQDLDSTYERESEYIKNKQRSMRSVLKSNK